MTCLPGIAHWAVETGALGSASIVRHQSADHPGGSGFFGAVAITASVDYCRDISTSLSVITKWCLDFGALHRDKFRVMVKSSLRNFVAVVLGLLLALSMSLSAAQASMSAMKPMTMASAMETSGPHVCDACEVGKAMSLPCLVICGAPSLAVLPDASLSVMSSSGARLSLGKTALLDGIASPPPPFPPRTTYIG